MDDRITHSKFRNLEWKQLNEALKELDEARRERDRLREALTEVAAEYMTRGYFNARRQIEVEEKVRALLDEKGSEDE